MTRKQLEQFIENRMRMAKENTDKDFKENLFHQAFGAVEFFCAVHPDEEVTVAEWWNNNKWEEFWEIINQV